MPTPVIFYAVALPVVFLALSFVLVGYPQIRAVHSFAVGAVGFGLSAALLLCYLPSLEFGSAAWVGYCSAALWKLYAAGLIYRTAYHSENLRRIDET